MSMFFYLFRLQSALFLSSSLLIYLLDIRYNIYLFIYFVSWLF